MLAGAVYAPQILFLFNQTLIVYFMSIIVSDLGYCFPDRTPLFSHLNFTVAPHGKVALIGNNGTGKSTLLKIIAGCLSAVEGSVLCPSQPYYVPQHIGLLNRTIAAALGVSDKLIALKAILNGSLSQADYDKLADDWELEVRLADALAYWGLVGIDPEMPIDNLSGGEKTKVFLAGLQIHQPEVVLLDEPTNHLDLSVRQRLYGYIAQSSAAMLIVSHDVTLLNQLSTTCELSEKGIRLYGGNYSFYKEQKAIEANALNDDIREEEKALRLARKKAIEVSQRQERRSRKGAERKSELPRIMQKNTMNKAENSSARLKDKHEEIIESGKGRLGGLLQQKELNKQLKIDFAAANLHTGKLLIEAKGLNHAYGGDALWSTPLDFSLYSGDRVHITGNNGSGKSTLVRLLLGELQPATGAVVRMPFSYAYLDQNYTQMDAACTVEEMAERHNHSRLQEHEVKLRLNRFLFPADAWGKKCNVLSGGERMRLYLCCLMLANQTPGLFVLDEPTNNLDIASLQILTQTIKEYCGSLLVVSHDSYFVSEIGVDRRMEIKKLNN